MSDAAPVKAGLDVLLENNLDILRGKICALITNHTGQTFSGKPNWQALIEKGIAVKSVFIPEKDYNYYIKTKQNLTDTNITGVVNAPVFYRFSSDNFDILRICSSLKDVDILLYDIQGMGTRFFHHIEVLLYFLTAAADCSKKMIVLDRPAPINGIDIEGNIPDLKHSFFGCSFRIPILTRYGLTAGELAILSNEERITGTREKSDLQIIKMDNWKRNMWYDQTGLPPINFAEDIKDIKSILSYISTIQFEHTNLGIGIGTPNIYRMIYAPWINSHNLSEALNNLELPGVFFAPIEVTPSGKLHHSGTALYDGIKCEGVYININSRKSFKPVYTALSIAFAVYDLYSQIFNINEEEFDTLWGSEDIKRNIFDGEPSVWITEKWEITSKIFHNLSEKYYLYK